MLDCHRWCERQYGLSLDIPFHSDWYRNIWDFRGMWDSVCDLVLFNRGSAFFVVG
jgi:hypothetical protein